MEQLTLDGVPQSKCPGKSVSLKKTEGWIEDTVGVFFDSIIVMPGGWGESLPDWLKERVTFERLIENMQAIREGRDITATNAEVACYLYTASLSAPIGSDWTEIYTYVVSDIIKAHTKNELPEDMRVNSLTESQWRDLKHLKSWIYEARLKHRKEKARGQHQEAKEEAEKKELETRAVQPSFF